MPMHTNGGEIPKELDNKLEKIYKLVGEFERYRHHPLYYYLPPLRAMLGQMVMSFNQLYFATMSIDRHINHASNHLIAEGGSADDATAAGATAHEAYESLNDPQTQEYLESILDCAYQAASQFLEVFKKPLEP